MTREEKEMRAKGFIPILTTEEIEEIGKDFEKAVFDCKKRKGSTASVKVSGNRFKSLLVAHRNQLLDEKFSCCFETAGRLILGQTHLKVVSFEEKNDEFRCRVECVCGGSFDVFYTFDES